MYQLYFYVPESHLERVKEAVFEAGGGLIGRYDRCAWQTEGEGQFRPLPGSSPYLGESGRLERVKEYRVELVVTDDRLPAVLEALLAAHPYEEPAYGAIRIETHESLGKKA
jgi:hypothetical protein